MAANSRSLPLCASARRTGYSGTAPYGAVIVDTGGTHWLIDVNAGGQWAFVDCTRTAITHALADLLEKAARHD